MGTKRVGEGIEEKGGGLKEEEKTRLEKRERKTKKGGINGKGD